MAPTYISSILIPLESGEGSENLFNLVSFNHIINLDIIIVEDFDTTFEAFTHFANIIFEALERFEPDIFLRRWIDHYAIPDQSYFSRSFNGALGYITTCNGTNPADFEGIAHHSPAKMNNIFAWFELSF